VANNNETRPLLRGSTTPFGDEFVSTGQDKPGADRTRPLPNAPATQNLVAQVSAKIGDTKKELDYIRHLVNLFAPPIAVLKTGVKLSEFEEQPAPQAPQVDEALIGLDCHACREAITGEVMAGICMECAQPYHVPCWAGKCASQECGSTEFMAPEPPPPPPTQADLLMGLAEDQADLAQDIGVFLQANPKVKQRAQVCLFQYEEAYRSYQESQTALDEAVKLPPAAAWDKLHEMGIERVKGKAYAICGFYENFKGDGPVGLVFPPPRNKEEPPQNATRPLGAPPTKAPTRPQPQSPADDDAPLPIENTIGGLLGKIKGLFK